MEETKKHGERKGGVTHISSSATQDSRSGRETREEKKEVTKLWKEIPGP
jgi:hypothetical protein